MYQSSDIWRTYFKIRIQRFRLFLWGLFATYSVLTFFITAVVTILVYLGNKTMPPEKLLDLTTIVNMMTGWGLLGGGALVIILMFLAFLILSTFNKGRIIADRTIKFLNPTESELFKEAIETRLATIEKQLGVLGKQNQNEDKTIGDINREIREHLKSISRKKK
jgi:hypothetical protein